MRKVMPDKLEAGRVTTGRVATNSAWGPYGVFIIQGPCGSPLKIVASGDDDLSVGWEHVSVSTPRRCPNWIEMCYVKDLFWEEEECVMQLHPPKSEYVNNHPYCLHLWRPTRETIPMPPSIMVGDKNVGTIDLVTKLIIAVNETGG